MTRLETKVFRFVKSSVHTSSEEVFGKFKNSPRMLIARALDNLHLSRKISCWYSKGVWGYVVRSDNCVCQMHKHETQEYQRAFKDHIATIHIQNMEVESRK